MDSTSKLTLIQKLKTQPIYREKFLYTVWICWAFIMLGWSEAMFGPTLPDLRLIIGKSLDTASWLFTASSAGFLVGSGITGVLYDRYNRLPLMIGSIIGTAIATVAIPWCKSFWLMIVVKTLAGMLAASLDTGGNAEIVSTWGGDSDSFMQALHFCFSLGGMISPFVAQPFLLETPDSDSNVTCQNQNNTNNASFDRQTGAMYAWNQTNETDTEFMDIKLIKVHEDYPESQTFGNISNISLELNYDKDVQCSTDYSIETNVQYAYLISAILILLTAIPFSIVHYIQPKEKAKLQGMPINRQPTDFNKRPLIVKVMLLGMLSLLMFVYVGTDDVYAGLLMTFVISHLKWSKVRGSLATSLHWISFGIARLGCIFLVRYVKTSKLMVTFGCALVLSYTGLLLATIYNMQSLIWLFICFPGFSMSLIFPAMFTWTNEHVVNISGKISAMFLMSSSVGVMVFPPLHGHTMEAISPITFIYLLLGQSTIWIVLFIVTLILTNTLLAKRIEKIGPEIEPLTIEMKQVSLKSIIK